MKESRDGPPTEDPHASRVTGAFESLRDRVGSRLDPEAHASVERLRDAAASRDTEAMRENLGQLQKKHGWLYEELAAHPEISALINELALWGF